MKFDMDLLSNMLWVSMICQVLSVLTIQKVKSFKCVKRSCYVIIFSIFINIFMGVAVGRTFTDLDYIMCLWVGYFSWIGADTLYKSLRKKNLIKGLTEFLGEEGE